MRRLCLPLLLGTAVCVCSHTSNAASTPPQPSANVTNERLLNAANDSQWLTYSGTYDEQRYSHLKQIDTQNVAKLGLAWFADFPTNLMVEDAPRSFISRLIAFDPVTGKQAWSTPDFPAGTGGVQLTSGALATAGGIVFHGDLPNREFVAYRATNGERLWKYDIKTGMFNGAITYELDGDQYIAVAVGGPGQLVDRRP
jgi:glucose dehydrogenase